jgi:hypothetical protein
MHIAIDDTYGPEIDTGSSFITGDRRTHFAIIFPDKEVQDIQTQVTECLAEMDKLTGIAVKEFHFVDIYNRKHPWNTLPNQLNLRLFEFFASIYNHYKWPVFIQTVDIHTLADHSIDGLVGKLRASTYQTALTFP